MHCAIRFYGIQFATIVQTVSWRSLYRSKTVPELQFDITCLFVWSCWHKGHFGSLVFSHHTRLDAVGSCCWMVFFVKNELFRISNFCWGLMSKPEVVLKRTLSFNCCFAFWLSILKPKCFPRYVNDSPIFTTGTNGKIRSILYILSILFTHAERWTFVCS